MAAKRTLKVKISREAALDVVKKRIEVLKQQAVKFDADYVQWLEQMAAWKKDVIARIYNTPLADLRISENWRYNRSETLGFNIDVPNDPALSPQPKPEPQFTGEKELERLEKAQKLLLMMVDETISVDMIDGLSDLF